MNKIFLITILILAAFLRFYNLATNPPSLNWDEASLGYNSWTLLKYGTDEYGNKWPFSIRSFNDYKPPLYSYLTMIPIAIFGLTEFSTRFISAFLGTLTVFVVFFLTKEFFPPQHTQKGDTQAIFQTKALPLTASLLLAISPWHLQFSRGAFEGNIAVFFTTTGLYFLLKWLRKQVTRDLVIATLSLTASLYAYHAARLVIPLLGIIILVRYHKKFIQKWKTTLLCALLVITALTPLVAITLRGNLAARANAVSIFNKKYLPENIIQREISEKQKGNALISLWYDHRLQYIPVIIKGYLNHYSIYHIFIAGDVVNRHHAPDMGLLYLIELPFIVIGLALQVKKSYKGKLIFWSWWLLAPLPAALASGTPHAIRSILWLPLPQIATAVGLIATLHLLSLYPAHSKSKNQHDQYSIFYRLHIYTLPAILVVLFIANITYYLIQYHIHQPVENARHWQYGYKQMITAIKDIYPQFPQVLVTTANDQPYIFFLFYEQYDLNKGANPGDFNRFYKNIEFKAIDYLKERQREHILIVGAGDEVPPGEPIPITEIDYPDGTTAYRIFKRPPKIIY